MGFFIEAFSKSLYDVRWLFAHRKAAGKAWSYFFLFVFLTSLVVGIPAVREMHILGNNLKNAVERMPDFTATVERGALRVDGIVQPYVWTPVGGQKQFAVIIDTASTSTVEQSIAQLRSSYQEFVFISKESVAVYDGQQDKTQIRGWSGMEGSGTVRKSTVIRMLDTWFGSFRTIFFFLILIGIFIAFVAGKLLYVLVVSLVLRVAAAVTKRPVSVSDIFTIGLFAITLPTILKSILFLFHAPLPVYTPVFLVLVIMALWQSKGEGSAKEDHPSTNVPS